MRSLEVRESFLKFFEGKGHKVVESCSLLPEAPNLLFTNAGMNPFVPYFLGERTPNYRRIADTQKCIRAGGKHNDLEDVGFDTYHHTFFEMLGNWSLGDYFKKEAIEWAWELLTRVWKFPKDRLYATVYKPSAENDPAEFDSESYDIWRNIFVNEGMNPDVHIVYGNSKDNFWMMGETGPCGPCTEIHMDLTQNGDTAGCLVNRGDVRCMEIWNVVFIQYNAMGDGTFCQLNDKFVDTGMGLERVAGICASTNNFADFSKVASNYDSDLFTCIFKKLEEWSGHYYCGRVAKGKSDIDDLTEKDCAFRILADHIRTLTFSIADGILPGNEGRNYVLRRILRRAVLFGQKLSLQNGFFAELSHVVVEKMGRQFPELEKNRATIEKVLKMEENSFHATLQKGMQLFEKWSTEGNKRISGDHAFLLYDTYGFPLDLTQLMADEKGLSVDVEGFNECMREQQMRSQASQKKTIIEVQDENSSPTTFVGYDKAHLNEFEATLQNVIEYDGKTFLIFDKTIFYAEKGGQVGDTCFIKFDNNDGFEILDTCYSGNKIIHKVVFRAEVFNKLIGHKATMEVDMARRKNIARHHTATHLLHWALRKVLGDHVKQAGSFVTPDYLRFDFSHFEKLESNSIDIIEKLCFEKILENSLIVTDEVNFEEKPKDCIAFFGDKYGDVVRVVKISDFSTELCGGTHITSLGELGILKIKHESAIAAGIRRIEAVVGDSAFQIVKNAANSLKDLESFFECSSDKIIDKYKNLNEQKLNIERKYLKVIQSQSNKNIEKTILNKNGLRLCASQSYAEDQNIMRSSGKQLFSEHSLDVLILYGNINNRASILVFCSQNAVNQKLLANEIIKNILTPFDGKGGGKPDFASGSANNVSEIASSINKFLEFITLDC